MGALDKAAKCVATALLSSATAQVLSPTAANSDPPVDDFLFNALPARDAQIGLNFEKATTDRWMTGYFTKHQQDNTTCPTYGESQWTGTVTVRNDRSLFYWYFDSRDDPENDPLIVWLNGGPGASSMMGLFTEMGPCWLEPNAPTAQPNPWSWNNNASLLFVDQPAGAGLSSLREGSSEPTNEEDTAKDFLSFLEIFFGDVFPNNKNRRIHIAAESYGGHYGPVYIQHVLQSQHQASVPFEGRIESLILINSVLDWTANFLGVYDFLCQERERVGLLNATACEYISSSMPEQEVLGRKCRLSYGGRECRAAFDHGMATIGAPFLDVAKADNRYMANINKTCVPTSYYPFCADPDLGNLTRFMNQDWVKTVVHKQTSFIFEDYNMDIHRAFRKHGAFMKPTTKELAYTLESGIRVLVLNGNLDYLVNTPGAMQLYDALQWTGRAEYQAKKWQPLPENINATGAWKGTNNGRLVFVAVDGAGHTVPSYARKGSLDIIQKWTQGRWRL